MAVVINGNGTVTGISVGGLPDGIVDSGTLATNSVDSAELIDGAIDTAHIAADQITSAILPTGSVLQVVSTLVGSSFSTTSLGFVDNGLSATITPSSTSSKILVCANVAISATSSATGVYGGMQVLRSSTVISNSTRMDLYSQYNHHTYCVDILDSPSTTSAVTYKVQVMTSNTSNTIDSPHYYNDHSITLMEIAG